METLGKTGRMDVIDVAKGVGMVFVVFAHVNYTPELLVLIYSFHMPLYFIISGMLFDRTRYQNFGVFLKRRFKTLILPYLIFCFTSLFYTYYSERTFPELYDISREMYINYFVQIFLGQAVKGVVNAPLWFVPCLLAVEIMYYFISKLDAKVIVPVVVVLAAFGWFLTSDLIELDNSNLPWTIDSALFALSYYALGNPSIGFVKKTVAAIKADRAWVAVCLEIILVCGILWFPLAWMNGKISLGGSNLGNGVLLFLTGVLGTVIIFAIAMLLEKSKFFAFCGKYSLYIMASHFMIRKWVLKKAYYSLGITWYKSKIFSQTVVPFLIVFTLSVLFTTVLVRIQKGFRKITSKK